MKHRRSGCGMRTHKNVSGAFWLRRQRDHAPGTPLGPWGRDAGRSPVYGRSAPPPPPHAHKSVLEPANPRMDSECASGCPWSTARATAPSLGRPTPGVVKQDKSSGGSVDTTKTRSGPGQNEQWQERPIGAAKGKQSDTEALCQPPPPFRLPNKDNIVHFRGALKRVLENRNRPPNLPPPPPLQPPVVVVLTDQRKAAQPRARSSHVRSPSLCCPMQSTTLPPPPPSACTALSKRGGRALNRRFGLTSGTAAVLAQGEGGVPSCRRSHSQRSHRLCRRHCQRPKPRGPLVPTSSAAGPLLITRHHFGGGGWTPPPKGVLLGSLISRHVQTSATPTTTRTPNSILSPTGPNRHFRRLRLISIRRRSTI